MKFSRFSEHFDRAVCDRVGDIFLSVSAAGIRQVPVSYRNPDGRIGTSSTVVTSTLHICVVGSNSMKLNRI